MSLDIKLQCTMGIQWGPIYATIIPQDSVTPIERFVTNEEINEVIIISNERIALVDRIHLQNFKMLAIEGIDTSISATYTTTIVTSMSVFKSPYNACSMTDMVEPDDGL